MVHTRGKDKRAFFAKFMVGNNNGKPFIKNDNGEEHEFFDLKAREEIARDILSVAQQVDAARLRLTRTEIKSTEPTQVFVKGGVISDWIFELPVDEEDNNLFTINPATGIIFLVGIDDMPQTGSGRTISLRAKAQDGSGVVIERAYSLWLLGENKFRVQEDLDSNFMLLSDPIPFSTARPNRTH